MPTIGCKGGVGKGLEQSCKKRFLSLLNFMHSTKSCNKPDLLGRILILIFFKLDSAEPVEPTFYKSGLELAQGWPFWYYILPSPGRHHITWAHLHHNTMLIILLAIAMRCSNVFITRCIKKIS